MYLVFFRYQKTSKNVQGIDFEDVTCKNICLFGKILQIKKKSFDLNTFTLQYSTFRDFARIFKQ